MSCIASVAGMVCTLEAGHAGTHHMVAGVCPTHGAPQAPTRRNYRPTCSFCGTYLVAPAPKGGGS